MEKEQDHQGYPKPLRNWNELKKGEEKSGWGDAMNIIKLGPVITWRCLVHKNRKVKADKVKENMVGKTIDPQPTQQGQGPHGVP